MRRGRRFALGVVAALQLVACGTAPPPAPEGGGDEAADRQPCAPRPAGSAATSTDLLVESPLPAVFTSGCAAGDPLRLGAFLSVPGYAACLLVVTDGAARGCCPGIAAGESYALTLIFRDEPRRLPLAEQRRNLTLGPSSTGVTELSFAGAPVDESFYDTDGDQIGNLTEWCAGTL